MKTIKIIDLLNKIANGEFDKLPKKIKFDNRIWNINYGEKNIYYTNDYCDDLFIIIFRENLNFTLNDKVEILEEEPRDIEVCGSWFTKSEYDKLLNSEDKKKILEKLNMLTFNDLIDMSKEDLVFVINEQRFKINEILDYLERKED